MSDPIPPSAADTADFRAARRAVFAMGRETARMDAVETLSRLIDEAEDLGASGASELLSIAEHLQKKRAFALLLVLCLLAGRAGLATPALKQREIQALIELGRLREAVREAGRLVDVTEAILQDGEGAGTDEKVWRAAMGNLGRAYKQLFVNSVAEGRQPDPADLRDAAAAYLEVWSSVQDAGTTYHGVNAAALIAKAVRDFGPINLGPTWANEDEARRIARTILDIHRDDLLEALSDGSAPEDIWTLATCGEAFLVLDMLEDAARCYGAYAGNPANSAFNLASSLRQLREIWGFEGESRTPGGAIVRVMKAALLNLDSAALDADDPAETAQTESILMSVTEARLIESDLSDAETAGAAPTAGFEAYFGKRSAGRAAGAMVDISRLAGAVQRARALCAIEALSGGGWQRIGTGFVVDGAVLHADWAGERLILTNYHVTAQSDASLSAAFARCRAVFVDLDPLDSTETQSHIGFADIVWQSDETGHDTVVLRPDGDLPPDCVALDDRSLTDYLPRRRDADRDGTDMHVVILGFPGGGKLSYSFGDEMLLDHDACPPGEALRPPLKLDGRPVRLHYRTPSQPGSSGSPVFEAGSWRLVGIHHRGRPDCPRLPPKTAQYEANEGIWLPSIRAAIAASKEAGAEFFSAGQAARVAGLAAAAGVTITDVSRQIYAKPLAGRTALVTAGDGGLPGHYVPFPGDDAGVQRLYLRQGQFEGDMAVFGASGSGFETIIGDDNRTQIQHTTADPFRMICSLVIRMAGGVLNYGTGFLIGRRTLVTAGHCLLAYPGAPEVEAIEIRPGRCGMDEPFGDSIGVLNGERVSVHPAWSERFDPLYDIGAIHLGVDIGSQLGWFRVGAPSPQSLERRWAHVTGYPGDKLSVPGSRAPLRAAEMWHHATPIAGANVRQVFYPADTYAGQSGAPVYVLDPDGRARVVAVHAYGIGTGGAAEARLNNSGVLLDAAMLQILADWRTVE